MCSKPVALNILCDFTKAQIQGANETKQVQRYKPYLVGVSLEDM